MHIITKCPTYLIYWAESPNLAEVGKTYFYDYNIMLLYLFLKDFFLQNNILCCFVQREEKCSIIIYKNYYIEWTHNTRCRRVRVNIET